MAVCLVEPAMALIWCAISAHGFGHAAQAVPVLNDLRRRIPDLRVILRTALPPSFFEARLRTPWELSPAAQDVGCVQRGPLIVDVQKTWAAHRDFHAGWEQKVEAEARAIRAKAPDLVLASISHLAIEAGARAGIPAIGLCNLSWDAVLEPHLEPGRPEQLEVLRLIRRAYGLADLMIRPEPGLSLPSFKKVETVAPIAGPLTPDRPALRAMVGAAPSERIVLVGFGGIALDSLPYGSLDKLDGFRFAIGGPVPEQPFTRLHRAADIPLPFERLLASADLLVTKPGYSTVVAAVACGVPVVYVRRHNFVDEESLVGYLHRHDRALELSREDFEAGRWEESLEKVLQAGHPAETPPVPRGAGGAADILARYLR